MAAAALILVSIGAASGWMSGYNLQKFAGSLLGGGFIGNSSPHSQPSHRRFKPS